MPAQKNIIMIVDKEPIIEGKLYSFWYEGDDGNIYDTIMERFYDRNWLYNFFKENSSDLKYFKIEDIEKAIDRTIDDLDAIDDLFTGDGDGLESFFMNLSHNVNEVPFQRSKGKLGVHQNIFRKSWVRIYALKSSDGIYFITGGAIKLTENMDDRKHTHYELRRLDQCMNFLKSKGFCDIEGFYEFLYEQ